MDGFEYRKLPHTRLVRINEYRLIHAGGVQALVGEQPDDIRVALDLVDVPVLVMELATNSVGAVSLCKERFAVLVSP